MLYIWICLLSSLDALSFSWASFLEGPWVSLFLGSVLTAVIVPGSYAAPSAFPHGAVHQIEQTFVWRGGGGGGSQNTSFSSELMIYQVPFCQVNHCTKFIIPSKWTAIKSLSLHNYIAGLLHSILPFFILLKEWNSLQTKLKRKKTNQEKKII